MCLTLMINFILPIKFRLSCLIFCLFVQPVSPAFQSFLFFKLDFSWIFLLLSFSSRTVHWHWHAHLAFCPTLTPPCVLCKPAVCPTVLKNAILSPILSHLSVLSVLPICHIDDDMKPLLGFQQQLFQHLLNINTILSEKCLYITWHNLFKSHHWFLSLLW